MLVQTLVENAVKHGIGQTKGTTDLMIRAAVDHQRLLIAVENSGNLLEHRGDRAPLGLKNLRERLKLLYGDHASLDLEENGDRVIATVAIPVVG
jgi:LytS/YehU family sensor histidine kinase